MSSKIISMLISAGATSCWWARSHFSSGYLDFATSVTTLITLLIIIRESFIAYENGL